MHSLKAARHFRATRMPALSPVATVLNDWPHGSGPIYRELTNLLRDAIQGGRLPGGTRLPPERQMAAHLNIARHTVARAYRDLERQALVLRRQGSGTVVAASSVGAGQSARLSSLLQDNVTNQLLATYDCPYDLLGAHAAPDLDVDELISHAIQQLKPSELTAQPGYLPLGYPPLRVAIARHLTAGGLPSTPEQVIVTSGAQQAITLIATGLLHGRRSVIVEDPTFSGAIDAFRMAGARLLSVPMTAEGPDLDRFSSLVEDSDAGLAYLIPTFHNPTGALMSSWARDQIVELAAAMQLMVVEDNATADLPLTDELAIPLGARDRSGTVLTIGSLSKLVWGGLRIGWIRGPEDLIGQFGQLKATADLGTSIFSQAIAAAVIEHAATVRAIRRRQVHLALDQLTTLLHERLPHWSWVIPRGGLSLWVRIPYGSASQFAMVARRHGVGIVPGPVMSVRGIHDDHIRLPLGRPLEIQDEAVLRLGRAWEEYARGPISTAREFPILV
jgi:DNA-binding transcriptional MocR family regulator